MRCWCVCVCACVCVCWGWYARCGRARPLDGGAGLVPIPIPVPTPLPHMPVWGCGGLNVLHLWGPLQVLRLPLEPPRKGLFYAVGPRGRDDVSAGYRPPSLFSTAPQRMPPPPCVTFRRVVVSLRGPGQSPGLPFACCVGSLRSVGRCGRCSCWCRFRVRGAQWLVCRGCAGCCGGRLTVFAVPTPPSSGIQQASLGFRVREAPPGACVTSEGGENGALSLRVPPVVTGLRRRDQG